MKTPLKLEPAWTTPQRVRPARPLAAVALDHAKAMARRIGAALRHTCRRSLHDPRSAYLSQATNHVDLERRLRAWDDHQLGRRRWPPTL